MESSPKGRFIEYVDGSPGGIISRGEDITELGQQMLDSATTLENIKTRAIDSGGQTGKAIEGLRESIGDSFDVLRQAGELYKPVGPVIETYGKELDEVQPLIKAAVDDCEDRWATYESLPGDKEGSVVPVADDGFLGMGGHDADSPEAQQQADENAAKREAYQAWEERADDFDRYYDTWEDAFDTAVDGIGDKMSGSIKDGFWEVLGDIGDVLGKVGLIVGIAALVLGGPFTAIAFALAAAAVAVAAVQMFDSSKSWGERFGNLGLATLGVVPFGRFGKLMSGNGKFMDDVVGLGGRGGLGDAAAPLFNKPKGLADGLLRAMHGQSLDDFTSIARNMDDLSIGKAFLSSQLDIVGAQGKHFVDVWQGVETGRDWINDIAPGGGTNTVAPGPTNVAPGGTSVAPGGTRPHQGVV